MCILERKLQPHEHPHTLYIQNYSTASATCLAIRRWLFNVNRSLSEQALTWIFWQTIDEVNRGHITAGERLYQLKALQDASRKHEVRSHSETAHIFIFIFMHALLNSLRNFAVSKIGEGTQRIRRYRVPTLCVRFEKGRPRHTRGGHGSFQIARRERRRNSGIASGGVSVEHHRPMGSGRGWNGVLLPIHAPG